MQKYRGLDGGPKPGTQQGLYYHFHGAVQQHKISEPTHLVEMIVNSYFSQVGDLLKDWRRLNVSFTRARSKLIIIGSRKTLQGTPMLAESFRLMDSKDWIYSLLPSSDVLHRVTRTKTKRPPSPVGKENTEILHAPKKRPKLEAKPRSMQAILRGRPILRDLLAEGAGNIWMDGLYSISLLQSVTWRLPFLVYVVSI